MAYVKEQPTEQEEIARTKVPRGKEVIGVLEQRLAEAACL